MSDARMATKVPTGFADLAAMMAAADLRIRRYLDQIGLHSPAYPTDLPAPNERGVAAARAYPMQGVLKYHGLADWQWRTAFLPSISVNNAGA